MVVVVVVMKLNALQMSYSTFYQNLTDAEYEEFVRVCLCVVYDGHLTLGHVIGQSLFAWITATICCVLLKTITLTRYKIRSLRSHFRSLFIVDYEWYI